MKKADINPSQELIKEFLTSIKEQLFSVQALTGGTQGETFLVNRRYVFKAGHPTKLKSELLFNNYYNGQHFVQKLVFCDKMYRYIVYNYIPGEIEPQYPNAKIIWKQMVKFIAGYLPYYEQGFGDLNKPSETWTQFLTKLVDDCKSNLKGVFLKQDFEQLSHAITTLESYSFEKKLLHGDLRLENLVFNQGVLAGVIDPYPMIGDPLYDLLFFYISTPDMVTHTPLNKLHKVLKQPIQKVQAYLLIVLCVKLKRIIKYQNDMEHLAFYKDLWQRAVSL